jgi:hypothetical protein
MFALIVCTVLYGYTLGFTLTFYAQCMHNVFV